MANENETPAAPDDVDDGILTAPPDPPDPPEWPPPNTGPIIRTPREIRSPRELPSDIANQIDAFADPRCRRCDCQLAKKRRVDADPICDRCYEDESTDKAIAELADLRKEEGRTRVLVTRILHGVNILRGRVAVADRQVSGPPLFGNEETPGKRYLPLVPVLDQTTREIIGWQTVGNHFGPHATDVIFRSAKAAVDIARGRPTSTPANVRVLEIDIVDLRDVDLTDAQRHEHAERMYFRWAEEERALRPTARERVGSSVLGSMVGSMGMPDALRAMALAAQRADGKPDGHLCLQCSNNPKEHGLPFCVPCAADVLDKLGRAISAMSSMMGQMEVAERPVPVADVPLPYQFGGEDEEPDGDLATQEETEAAVAAVDAAEGAAPIS